MLTYIQILSHNDCLLSLYSYIYIFIYKYIYIYIYIYIMYENQHGNIFEL